MSSRSPSNEMYGIYQLKPVNSFRMRLSKMNKDGGIKVVMKHFPFTEFNKYSVLREVQRERDSMLQQEDFVRYIDHYYADGGKTSSANHKKDRLLPSSLPTLVGVMLTFRRSRYIKNDEVYFYPILQTKVS